MSLKCYILIHICSSGFSSCEKILIQDYLVQLLLVIIFRQNRKSLFLLQQHRNSLFLLQLRQNSLFLLQHRRNSLFLLQQHRKSLFLLQQHRNSLYLLQKHRKSLFFLQHQRKRLVFTHLLLCLLMRENFAGRKKMFCCFYLATKNLNLGSERKMRKLMLYGEM